MFVILCCLVNSVTFHGFKEPTKSGCTTTLNNNMKPNDESGKLKRHFTVFSFMLSFAPLRDFWSAMSDV